jgi:hypothetical protein
MLFLRSKCLLSLNFFLHVSSVSAADTNTFHHGKDVGHTDPVCYPPLTEAPSSVGTRNNLGMSELQNQFYERSDDHLEGGITGLPFNNLNNLGSSSLCDLLQSPTDVNVKLNTPSMLPMSVRKEGTRVYLGGRLSTDEVVKFGGIPAPSEDICSSERIRLQFNADATQMDRAQQLTKAKNTGSCSGTNSSSKYF